MAAIRGARAAISLHVTSGVHLPDGESSDALLGPGRSSGHPHQRLGLDGFCGSAVLLGQPVHVEVQVDPRRGDGAVTGLGLDGFDDHPRLAQAGEAGVAQLVTGAVAETGPLPGGADDLVQTRHRERLSPMHSLSETKSESVVASTGRSRSM